MTFSDMAPFLGMALTSLLTYMLTKKKQDKEIDKLKLGNVHEVIDIWKALVDGLKKDVKDLTAQVKELRFENGTLKGQLIKLEDLLKKNPNN